MYEQSRRMDDHRFQELYSDDDDNSVHGRRLNPKRSDDFLLQHNIRSGRYSAQSSEEHLAYGNHYDSSDEDGEDSGEQSGSQQVALREQEDLLAQRAQERIRNAKAKGRPTVNLTHDELEALERRFASEAPDRQRKKSAAGSGKGSPSGNGAWTRKRSSSRPVGGALTPAKQRSRGTKRMGEAPAADEAYSSGAAPPGVMIPGPTGAPVFSPLGYYNAQPAAFRAGRGEDSRKSMAGSRYNGPPPTAMQYPVDTSQYRQSRNASNASDVRPLSSSSRASSSTYFSEADYWSRSRSSSNAAPYPTEGGVPLSAYSSYAYPTAAGAPPGRRVVSGPPDVNQAHVYRRPIPPTAQVRGRPPQSSSNPALGNRASALSQEEAIGSSSEDEEDDALRYERRSRGVSQDRRSRK